MIPGEFQTLAQFVLGFHGQEAMRTMRADIIGANPLLPAIGGMFVISLLDTLGVLPGQSPLTLALFYGLFGAGGGIASYWIVRRLRR